ncbi:MAG TPA: hypothetical protein VFF33_01295 [Ignavibacteriaceae bacterium]|nr:hypothetical protein [Ignavibacteriaceae bacterium]
MGILDNIKDKIALGLVNKELKKNEFLDRSFATAFRKSFSFFVIMPTADPDFHHSFEVLRGLDSNKKTLTIFLNDFKVSLLPQVYRRFAMDYNIEDISKLNLPSKKLVEKVTNLSYNAVIDLNRDENVFCSYITSIVNSPIKIGFHKANGDRYYNMQIVDTGQNPESTYKNFINSIQMF